MGYNRSVISRTGDALEERAGFQVLDVACRQRMLCQRLLKEALGAALGLPFEPWETIESIRLAVEVIRSGLDRTTPRCALSALLDEQSRLADNLANGIERLGRSMDRDGCIDTTLEGLFSDAERFHIAADRTIQSLANEVLPELVGNATHTAWYSLLDATPDLILRIRRDGTYLDCRPARGFPTVVSPADFIGKTVLEVMPNHAAQQIMRGIAAALETQKPVCEHLRILRRGNTHDSEARFLPEGIDTVVVLVRDVSEEKETERRVIDELDARQAELAADLHDCIGQQLTGSLMMLKVLRDRVKGELPAAEALVEMVQEGLEEALLRTAQMVRGTSPLTIDDTGDDLADSIGRIADQAERTFGLPIRLSLEAIPTIPRPAARQLCLIAQEAITNSIKYGLVGTTTVSLSAFGDACKLRIANAPGPTKNSGAGQGLRIMRYRARLIGATITFERRTHEVATECQFSIGALPLDEEHRGVRVG